MKYIGFILNKVRKDTIHVIPFLLMGVFIVFIYVGNRDNAYSNINDPMLSGENELVMLKENLKSFDTPNQDEFYTIMKDKLKYTQGKLDAIENKNWTSYFENSAELATLAIKGFEQGSQYYDKEVIDSLNTTKKYNTYMAEHNLSFDERFSSMQGISYMTFVMNKFFPVMLAVFLVFITSKMYCSGYRGSFDIQKLLPYSPLKKQCIKLCSGMLIGLFILLFVSGLSIVSGSIGNTFGSFSSPVLIYTTDGASEYTSFLSILSQTMVLIFLSILFITNFVSVISKITRKNMTCLLISLGIILGFLLVLQDIVPLYEYIHLFPTTYINSLQVVSGQLTFISNNINVNFANGLLVLLITNVILFAVDAFLPKFMFRSVRTK